MKTTILAIFFISTVSLISKDISDIFNKYSINKGNITLIAFLDPINCIKCKLNIDNMINCLDSKIQLNKTISVIGFMRINRKVEFTYYKKNLNWKYPIFIFDNKFNSDLGIKNNMDFIVLSEQRKIIYQNNLSGITNIPYECKKIIEIIDK